MGFVERTMSIPKEHPGHIIQQGKGDNPLIVEMFLDVTCPFSNKMFETVVRGGLMRKQPAVRFVIHQVVQPWHAQSTWAHEALFAARKTAKNMSAFVQVMDALLRNQEKYTDVMIWDKTRAEVQSILLDAVVEGGGDRDAVSALLKIDDEGIAKGFKNPGSLVTPDLKVATKFHRKRGVH